MTNIPLRHAFVIGATGLIGRELTRQLCQHEAYRAVTIGVRRKLDFTHPKLIQQELDFSNLDNGLNLQGVDDAFCALGTTIRKAGSQEQFRVVDLEYPRLLARCARRDGVQQMLVVSSLGADPASSNFYLQTKGQMEHEVTRAFGGSTQIFRPSLLLGDREEFRLGEKIAAALMKLAKFVMVGPFRRYRPIEGRKVAAAMIAAAVSRTAEGATHESEDLAALAASFGTRVPE